MRRHIRKKLGYFDRIVVLLFWGRRRYTSLLKPYLTRELVAHGGVVDEIWLCVTTSDAQDVSLAHDWSSAQKEVVSYDVHKTYPQVKHGIRYGCLGDLARNGSRTLFIKVDDDIVRMERHALAYLSAHKLFHASSSFRRDGLVSANVINHSTTTATSATCTRRSAPGTRRTSTLTTTTRRSPAARW